MHYSAASCPNNDLLAKIDVAHQACEPDVMFTCVMNPFNTFAVMVSSHQPHDVFQPLQARHITVIERHSLVKEGSADDRWRDIVDGLFRDIFGGFDPFSISPEDSYEASAEKKGLSEHSHPRMESVLVDNSVLDNGEENEATSQTRHRRLMSDSQSDTKRTAEIKLQASTWLGYGSDIDDCLWNAFYRSPHKLTSTCSSALSVVMDHAIADVEKSFESKYSMGDVIYFANMGFSAMILFIILTSMYYTGDCSDDEDDESHEEDAESSIAYVALLDKDSSLKKDALLDGEM